MNRIILNNGKELCLACMASMETRFENGANRQVMQLEFLPETIGLDELVQLFSSPENTRSLCLVLGQGEERSEYIHKNHTLLLSASAQKSMIAPADTDTPASYQLRHIVRLGQLTYLEKQREALGVVLEG